MPEIENLQEKMAVLMLRKKLSMRALSREAGLSETFVYDWLRRGVRPRREHLERVAEVLGVPVSEIINDLELSAEEEELIQQYRVMQERDREAVRQMAGFLASKRKSADAPGDGG